MRSMLKKFIDMNNSKVLISGKRIDVIDHIMDEYLEYLRIATDQESGYEYRHLSAWKILVMMTNRIFTPVTNNGNIKHS